MKIYISGINSAGNCKRLADVESFLLSIGFDEVMYGINPDGKTQEQCLLMDMKTLLSCDAIFVSEGWQCNKQASIERYAMKTLNKICIYESEREDVSMDLIIDAVLKVFNVNFETIVKRGRTRRMTYARTILTYYMRRRGFGVVTIGQRLNREHSVVTFMMHKHHDALRYDKEYRKYFFEVQNIINEV